MLTNSKQLNVTKNINRITNNQESVLEIPINDKNNGIYQVNTNYDSNSNQNQINYSNNSQNREINSGHKKLNNFYYNDDNRNTQHLVTSNNIQNDSLLNNNFDLKDSKLTKIQFDHQNQLLKQIEENRKRREIDRQKRMELDLIENEEIRKYQ